MTFVVGSMNNDQVQRRTYYLAQAARMRARAANAVDPEIHRTFLLLAAQSFRVALQVGPEIGGRRGATEDPTSQKKLLPTTQLPCLPIRHREHYDYCHITQHSFSNAGPVIEATWRLQVHQPPPIQRPVSGQSI